MMEDTSKKRPLIRPKALQQGDTIALIAPCSPAATVRIDKAIDNLKSLGFQVKEGLHLRKTHGFLAGTDEERLADLHAAFANPDVQGVWCVRGGYGATRIIDQIDYKLIKNNPKPFVGYSDVTALHLAIHQMTGLVTFHGQVAAGDFPEDTTQYVRSALMQGIHPVTIGASIPETGEATDAFRPFVIREGRAEGVLTGGNLSLLAPLIGTRFAPSYKNKIVFIEDIGEQPYRIDRLLTQLLNGTDLPSAAGIVLGVFHDCQPKGDSPSFTLAQTLTDRLGSLGIPVFYGLQFGHIPHQAMFPYGIRAAMDTTKMQLTLLDTGVM